MYLDLGLTLKSCNGFCIVTKYYVEWERKRKAILTNQKENETYLEKNKNNNKTYEMYKGSFKRKF